MKNNYSILISYSENAHLHTYVYLETFAVKLLKKTINSGLWIWTVRSCPHEVENKL